jgi:hypothetical protein
MKTPQEELNDEDLKLLKTKVITNRFRLSLACFFLGLITLFDPSIVIAMLTGYYKEEILKAKRKKAEILYKNPEND